MLKVPNQDVRYLIEARALIEDEKNWCTGRLVDEQGRMCAWGALNQAIMGNPGGMVYGRSSGLLWAAALEKGHTPAGLNNTEGHAATLAMFDRAIQLGMEEENAEATE